MIEDQETRSIQVIGPLGEALTFNLLPLAETPRWTVRRKAEVVAAVSGGLLSVDEACERYSLSVEEFTSWERSVNLSGMQGLRVTRLQEYRQYHERLLGLNPREPALCRS